MKKESPPRPHITAEALDVINRILESGKSVEIRRRKSEIVILEISAKQKKTFPANGRETGA